LLCGAPRIDAGGIVAPNPPGCHPRTQPGRMDPDCVRYARRGPRLGVNLLTVGE